MGAADRGEIKDKPITVNLKQLFPALKRSLLTFFTISHVFSCTFSACTSERPWLHFAVYQTLGLARLKLEVKPFLKCIYRNLKNSFRVTCVFYTFQSSFNGCFIFKCCIYYFNTQQTYLVIYCIMLYIQYIGLHAITYTREFMASTEMWVILWMVSMY